MPKIELNIDELNAEKKDLGNFLARPDAYSDPDFTTKNKRFTELEAIIAGARRGSFRAAAHELGMSPTALSNAVAALEKRLDVRLFNRTTRSVSLTAAGRSFVDGIALPLFALSGFSSDEDRERAARVDLGVVVRRLDAQVAGPIVEPCIEPGIEPAAGE